MKETERCNDKCLIYRIWSKSIYKDEEHCGMLRKDGTCMASGPRTNTFNPRSPASGMEGINRRDERDSKIRHAHRMNNESHGYGYED